MPTVRYTVLNGEVIADKRAGVRRLYVPDPLGSTVALLDSTQTKTDTFTYWPYGEEASRTGTTPTPFRYVGTRGYYRDRLNSIYVRARHYRPDVGRWVTRDPLGLSRLEWNPYRYVGNNPITAHDPEGLFSCWWCRILGLEHPCGQSWCWSHCEDGRHCKKPRQPKPGPPPGVRACGALDPWGPHIRWPRMPRPDEPWPYPNPGFTPAECTEACAMFWGPQLRDCLALCAAVRGFDCEMLWYHCWGLKDADHIRDCLMVYDAMGCPARAVGE